MIELPSEKVKADRVNPKSIVIFSQPKMGKTTAIAGLDNCLILDLEGGSGYVDAMKIDVIAEAKKQNILPIMALRQIIDAIAEQNNKNKGFVYKYVAIDTITALEDLVLPIANNMYTNTPMGRNWQGDDVTSLPNGAGYRYTRTALTNVITTLQEICDTLIILGHTKDKVIELRGKEMNERALDLTGKMSSILCGQVDAIGYLYREDNNTVINFAPSESLVCGSRSEHLKNQKIAVISSDDQGNLKIDWSKIFIDKK